jgi:hypothetical protein
MVGKFILTDWRTDRHQIVTLEMLKASPFDRGVRHNAGRAERAAAAFAWALR